MDKRISSIWPQAPEADRSSACSSTGVRGLSNGGNDGEQANYDRLPMYRGPCTPDSAGQSSRDARGGETRRLRARSEDGRSSGQALYPLPVAQGRIVSLSPRTQALFEFQETCPPLIQAGLESGNSSIGGETK